MRVVGYYNDLPGFIDSVYPNRATREDVNSATRTGGRVTFRFEPNENFNITPRLIYQKLETDGYPRADQYNILGNPYTTTEPAYHRGRTRPGDTVPRRSHRRIVHGRPEARIRLRRRHRPHLGDVVRRSQVVVVRDASQLTGSVTGLRRGNSRASADGLTAVRHHGPADVQPGAASRLDGRRSVPVGGGRVLSARGSRVRAKPADAGIRRLLLRRTPPGRDSAFYNAPPDTPYFSDLNYDFSSSRCSARRPTASSRSGP